MIAISTIGFYNSVVDTILSLFEDGLFKDFECMGTEIIQTKGLISIVDICLQPDLDKSYFGFSLSSMNENERNNAIQQVVHKTQLAIQGKCSNVIVWPGYLPGYKLDDQQKLQKNDIDKIKSDHDKSITLPMQHLCKSLFFLCKKFPDITFSIPSPRTFYEIPLYPHELEWIFEDVQCPNLKYWHNTSSSYSLEVSGFSSQEEWLEKHGENMVGIHLEDYSSQGDLLPLGTGEVNFKMLKSYIPKNCIKVLRMSEQYGVEGIKIAFDNVKSWI